MSKRLLVVDSKVSNIKSVTNALNYLKINYSITDTEFQASDYDYLILPGVGHFGKFAHNIKCNKLYKPILDFIERDKFFLGICVGMQYMFQSSEESLDYKGLNLIKEKVKKFKKEETNGKIPLIGKQKIKGEILNWNNTILKNFTKDSEMYFLHSYYCKSPQTYELSATSYNNFNFTSSIKIRNSYGVQFHPEKSGMQGLKIFQNFIELK